MINLKKRIAIALILNLVLFSASIAAFISNWEKSNNGNLIISAFAILNFMILIILILLKNRKIIFTKNN